MSVDPSSGPHRTNGNGHNGNGYNGSDRRPLSDPWSAVAAPAAGPLLVEPREEGLIEQAMRTVRKRKWLILQAAVLVPLIALVFSLSQTKQYSATASLLFRDPTAGLINGSSASSTTSDRQAATNDELVSLPVIADRTASLLHNGLTGSDISSMVTTSANAQGDVAKITATAKSGRLAAAVANAYGRAYIQFRQVADQARIANAIANLTRTYNQLTPAARVGPQGTGLKADLQTLQLAQGAGAAPAELVQPASAPTTPSSPKTARNVAFGLILGLILGFAIATLLERIDRRLKSIEELEESYGLPVLARIPRSRSLGKRLRQNPVQVMSEALSRNQEAEAFRTLRANLRYYNFDGGLKSVLVASPLSGEGKSTVASLLAVSMAAMGDRVVLVEADLRKSGEDTPLSDFGGDGLSLVLAGFDLDDALTEVPVSVDAVSEEPRTLVRLPHGPLPPNPSELLESDRMRWVIRQLEQRFDMVIIDSPALTNVSDALALVPQVSGVLIVSSLNGTTRHAALSLRKQLQLLGGHPLGLVANFSSTDESDYYYTRPYNRQTLSTAP